LLSTCSKILRASNVPYEEASGIPCEEAFSIHYKEASSIPCKELEPSWSDKLSISRPKSNHCYFSVCCTLCLWTSSVLISTSFLLQVVQFQITFFFWVNWDIVLASPFFNKSKTEYFLDDMFYKFKFVKFLYKRLIILCKKIKNPNIFFLKKKESKSKMLL